MSKRGDRIAERQKQCTGCQFLTSIKVRERGYGFCSAQSKQLCDMDIQKDCKYYKPKREG